MHFSTNLYLFKVIHYIYCTLAGYVAELPAILDRVFHGLANAISSSIGVESKGGGKPRSGRFLWFQKLDPAIWPQMRLPNALIITK